MQLKLNMTVMMPKFIPAPIACPKVTTTNIKPRNLVKPINITPNMFWKSNVSSPSL